MSSEFFIVSSLSEKELLCKDINDRYHSDCERAKGKHATNESIADCVHGREEYKYLCVSPEERDEGHEIQIKQQKQRLKKRGFDEKGSSAPYRFRA